MAEAMQQRFLNPVVERFSKPLVGVQAKYKDEKPLPIKILSGYKPYLNDNFSPRDDKMSDDQYKIIERGTYSDIIAAELDFNYVEDPKAASEKDEDGKSKEPVWKRVVGKRYFISQLDKTIDGYRRLRREIQICRFHSHENIVQFYEVFPEKDNERKLTHIWIVYERMDHSLEIYYDYLKKEPRKIDIRHLGSLLTQILRALDYLHQRGIMHRDISPKTVAMNQKDFKIKLLGFGLARELNQNLHHSTNVETPYIYRALEVMMKTPKYDTKIDIWATALVAIEMLGLRLFYPTGNDDEAITKKIRRRGAENAVMDRILEVLGVPADRYSNLFNRPVTEKPRQGTFKDELSDEFLNRRIDKNIESMTGIAFRELMEKMLDPDWSKRLRADECLKDPFLALLNVDYKYNDQPRNDEEMKKQNAQNKEEIIQELEAGYNRLSFRNEAIPISATR